MSAFVIPHVVSLCIMKKPTSKTANSEFTEETALAFFARHLDEQKWNYHRVGDGPTLFSGFNGDDALWDFNMCKRRLKSAAGVMCVTGRFKSAASSLTMKHVSQYE